MMRCTASFGALCIACASAGCGPAGEHEPIGSVSQSVVAPLPQAYCTINVAGSPKDTEGDYLPHVITCENGGANLQALKAQAIAARSVAYYNMATQGSICDSQGCQVYSCAAAPQAKHYQAVKETAGQYLSYGGMLTYGFYVAGDSGAKLPDCKDYAGTTSKYVTYNEGKTGTNVTQTSLGYIGPAGFGQNRGCMGQWGARCLENGKGYDYLKILQFYYGADIGILTAPGSCVVPAKPALDAKFVDQGSDAEPDPDGVAQFRVCAGQSVRFWFELENTGSASWVDWGASGTSDGQSVRLGVPDDSNDPFTGSHRVSLEQNANNDVHPASWDPPGGDCSDQPHCRRTVFSADAGISGTAPAALGVYETKWRLVDEGRAWFGPEMWLSFNVVECGSTGSGGASAGSGGIGGAGASSSGGTGAGLGPGASQQTTTQPLESGCGCRAAGTERREAWLALLALALLAARRRFSA
jgi:MYXO-CTERM domain-containing protein